MEQTLVNWILGILMAILGWLGKTVWDAVNALKKDIQKIEIELPSYYVKKDELQLKFDKFESMLNKILDKLDTKADK